MKKILLCILTLFGWLYTDAQTPKYHCSTWTGGAISSTSFNSDNDKVQSIYSGAYFPGMPKGPVTAVYLRCVATTARDTITYHNVEVAIGYTLDSAFKSRGNFDTFKTGLTRVYKAATHFFSGIAVTGTWLKFQADNFVYDPAKHFVVEAKHGSEGANNYGGFRLMTSVNTAPLMKTLVGRRDSTWVFNGQYSRLMDVGFDIAVNGVPGIENLRSLGLFPNPCAEGRFMLSLSSKQPMGDLSVTLTDVAGRRVLSKVYSGVGTDFFEGIRTDGLAKGMYVVHINAGGEHLSRPLVIQ